MDIAHIEINSQLNGLAGLTPGGSFHHVNDHTDTILLSQSSIESIPNLSSSPIDNPLLDAQKPVDNDTIDDSNNNTVSNQIGEPLGVHTTPQYEPVIAAGEATSFQEEPDKHTHLGNDSHVQDPSPVLQSPPTIDTNSHASCDHVDPQHQPDEVRDGGDGQDDDAQKHDNNSDPDECSSDGEGIVNDSQPRQDSGASVIITHHTTPSDNGTDDNDGNTDADHSNHTHHFINTPLPSVSSDTVNVGTNDHVLDPLPPPSPPPSQSTDISPRSNDLQDNIPRQPLNHHPSPGHSVNPDAGTPPSLLSLHEEGDVFDSEIKEGDEIHTPEALQPPLHTPHPPTGMPTDSRDPSGSSLHTPQQRPQVVPLSTPSRSNNNNNNNNNHKHNHNNNNEFVTHQSNPVAQSPQLSALGVVVSLHNDLFRDVVTPISLHSTATQSFYTIEPDDNLMSPSSPANSDHPSMGDGALPSDGNFDNLDGGDLEDTPEALFFTPQRPQPSRARPAAGSVPAATGSAPARGFSNLPTPIRHGTVPRHRNSITAPHSSTATTREGHHVFSNTTPPPPRAPPRAPVPHGPLEKSNTAGTRRQPTATTTSTATTRGSLGGNPRSSLGDRAGQRHLSTTPAASTKLPPETQARSRDTNTHPVHTSLLEASLALELQHTTAPRTPSASTSGRRKTLLPGEKKRERPSATENAFSVSTTPSSGGTTDHPATSSPSSSPATPSTSTQQSAEALPPPRRPAASKPSDVLATPQRRTTSRHSSTAVQRPEVTPSGTPNNTKKAIANTTTTTTPSHPLPTPTPHARRTDYILSPHCSTAAPPPPLPSPTAIKTYNRIAAPSPSSTNSSPFPDSLQGDVLCVKASSSRPRQLPTHKSDTRDMRPTGAGNRADLTHQPPPRTLQPRQSQHQNRGLPSNPSEITAPPPQPSTETRVRPRAGLSGSSTTKAPPPRSSSTTLPTTKTTPTPATTSLPQRQPHTVRQAGVGDASRPSRHRSPPLLSSTTAPSRPRTTPVPSAANKQMAPRGNPTTTTPTTTTRSPPTAHQRASTLGTSRVSASTKRLTPTATAPTRLSSLSGAKPQSHITKQRSSSALTTSKTSPSSTAAGASAPNGRIHPSVQRPPPSSSSSATTRATGRVSLMNRQIPGNQ